MRYAFFLALILLPISAHAEDAACPGRYSQLGRKYLRDFHDRMRGRVTLGTDIEAAIGDGFQTLGKNGQPLKGDWMKWDELSDSQRQLLERLPSLTPGEREKYLKLVQEAPARSIPGGRFKQFILLGLYDQPTWARLASNPAKFPVASGMAGRYLEKISANMPEGLKKEILDASGAHYQELTQADLSKSALLPKKAVDTYFKHLLKGNELINQATKQGTSPKEAFAAYVAAVQSHLKGGRFYSADETLDMIKLVQKSLRHKMLRGARGKGGAEPILYVGGGLPNGRASVALNDLDLGANFDISALDRRDIEKYLENYGKKIAPDSKINLSMRTLSPDYWEKDHPVMFKVRSSSIDMLVYDSKGNYRSYKIN